MTIAASPSMFQLVLCQMSGGCTSAVQPWTPRIPPQPGISHICLTKREHVCSCIAAEPATQALRTPAASLGATWDNMPWLDSIACQYQAPQEHMPMDLDTAACSACCCHRIAWKGLMSKHGHADSSTTSAVQHSGGGVCEDCTCQSDSLSDTPTSLYCACDRGLMHTP